MTDKSLIEGEYIVEKHYTHDGWVFPVVKQKLIRCKGCIYWNGKDRMVNGKKLRACEILWSDNFGDYETGPEHYCGWAEE